MDTDLTYLIRKQTGASKHYAFIEFAHSGVADIVAETMNNYLLTGHILQCRVIPAEEVHPKLWIGANRKFRPIPKGRVERLKHNAVSPHHRLLYWILVTYAEIPA